MTSPAATQLVRPTPELVPPLQQPRRTWRKIRGVLLILLAIACVLAVVGYFGYRAYTSLQPKTTTVPIARVKRGDVTFTVITRGVLQGGSPENLAAPMTGGEMHITYLKKPGEEVKAGDVVIKFDTSDREFKLREAQADVAEAEQQVLKAKSEADAVQEENRYSLLKARSDVRLAELEVRRNPLVSKITARQNDLALQAARDHLAQLEQDLANRSASGKATIEIEDAKKKKAEIQAQTAQRDIDQMTVRAKTDGYISIRQNTNINFYMDGMQLPLFRVGDRAFGGMVIAEIPDLKHWELAANIGELDRGHLAIGQPVEIHVVALPFRSFTGKVKNIGGMTGSFWDRHFEARITIEDPSAELRPGMNSEIGITTEVMKNVLSVPGQAVFESDGRTYVYVPSGNGFAPRDVKIVRRSESQAVVEGLKEGTTVALANPEKQTKNSGTKGGAMEAIPK